MTIEIDHLRDRARSFRRRAEWMLDGADRERLIAMACEYEARAVAAAIPGRLLPGIAAAGLHPTEQDATLRG